MLATLSELFEAHSERIILKKLYKCLRGAEVFRRHPTGDVGASSRPKRRDGHVALVCRADEGSVSKLFRSPPGGLFFAGECAAQVQLEGVLLPRCTLSHVRRPAQRPGETVAPPTFPPPNVAVVRTGKRPHEHRPMDCD